MTMTMNMSLAIYSSECSAVDSGHYHSNEPQSHRLLLAILFTLVFTTSSRGPLLLTQKDIKHSNHGALQHGSGERLKSDHCCSCVPCCHAPSCHLHELSGGGLYDWWRVINAEIKHKHVSVRTLHCHFDEDHRHSEKLNPQGLRAHAVILTKVNSDSKISS